MASLSTDIPIWLVVLIATVATGFLGWLTSEVVRLGRKAVEHEVRLRAIEPKGGGDD